MFKRDNLLLIFFIISVVIHLSAAGIYTILNSSSKQVFIGNVEVAFYSSSMQPVEQAPVMEERPDIKQETTDEKPATKEDVVVKNKDKEKKKEAPEKKIESVTPAPSARANARASQFENLSVNVKDFPYSYYTSGIQSQVRQNWQWTDESYSKLRVVVRFIVHRDGSTSGIEITESSNNADFDRMARRAISTSKFAPLPQEYKKEYLVVNFEFKNRK